MKQTICIMLLIMLICVTNNQLAQGRLVKNDLTKSKIEKKTSFLQSAPKSIENTATIQVKSSRRTRPRQGEREQETSESIESILAKIANLTSPESKQCRSADTTHHFTLTWSKLRDMANTVLRIFKQGIKLRKRVCYGTLTTYVYIPSESGNCSKEVYSSGQYSNCSYASDNNRRHAEMNMLKKCGWPTEFWLTNSPCTDCAKSLMRAYDNPEHRKPTIRVAHFYTGRRERGIDKETNAKQCLAKMVNKGFRFQPWNWTLFQRDNYMDNQACKEIVQILISFPSFNETQRRLEGILTEVNRMSNDSQVHTWCN